MIYLENYDKLLIGWSKLTLQRGVYMTGNTKYSSTEKSSRDLIISNFNWKISDGELVD